MAAVRILMVNFGRDAEFYRRQISDCDPRAAPYSLDDRLARYSPERQRVVVNRLLEKCFDIVVLADWWGNGRLWIEGIPERCRSRVVIFRVFGVAAFEAEERARGFEFFARKPTFVQDMATCLATPAGVNR